MLPEITHVIASLIANTPGGAGHLSVKEAVGLALATRPLRYGLSIEYAIRRYRALKRKTAGERPAPARALQVETTAPSGRDADRPDRTETRAMWDELVAKTDRRLAEHPEEDDFAAIDHILGNDSPSRYFLTAVYAEKLYYRRFPRKKGNGKCFTRKSHSRPRQ